MYLDRHEANPYHSFMRIGMMIDAYKPYVSGVTNYVSLHKRALEALGHKVFIFTFGGGAYDDEELYVIRSPGLPFNVQATGLQVSYRYIGGVP